MSEQETKFSSGQKIAYTAGIALYLAAFGYNAYSDFSKDVVSMGDIGTLTAMLVMFFLLPWKMFRNRW